ncbi:unnamed protein product [Microthlaspi erraticum]|uniref:Uncharacterized protein n=1 Tax=Microthlaspi erraticum TaxID=1685480 RepID=A0A6D2KBX6_9BRAS|nr:unnamed protein product [Microthlaspi erraticum]
MITNSTARSRHHRRSDAARWIRRWKRKCVWKQRSIKHARNDLENSVHEGYFGGRYQTQKNDLDHVELPLESFKVFMPLVQVIVTDALGIRCGRNFVESVMVLQEGRINGGIEKWTVHS